MAPQKGYAKRPWQVFLLSGVYLILPIFPLLILALANENSYHDFWGWYLSLDVALSFSAAFIIYSATPWSFAALYLIAGLKVLQQGLFIPIEAELRMVQYFHLMVWFCLPTAILVTKLRDVFFRPELQWWKQTQRYPYFAYGYLQSSTRFPIVTLNISESGALVKLDERLPGQSGADMIEKRELEMRRHTVAGRPLFSRTQIEQLLGEDAVRFPKQTGLKVKVGFPLTFRLEDVLKHRLFECSAEIVWIGVQDSYSRFHLGLRFLDLTERDVRNISRFVRVLKRKSRIAKTR